MSWPRKFAYDEARRLRDEGWTYQRIADRLGVSATAIARACNPARRAAMNRTSTAWIRENRRLPCLGECGALVWTHQKGRTGYCPACIGAQRAADGERPGELLCRKCVTWKSDEAFGKGSRQTRRGRRTWCRACEAANRKALRWADIEATRAYDRERKRRKAA